MKYLKLFEASRLMIDTNTLGDILQEITDLRYVSVVDSAWWSDDRGNSISICIYGKEEYDKQFGCDTNYIYVDEVMDVIDRLIDFLASEKYVLGEISKKAIDVIKGRPTEKTKNEIKVTTSQSSQVTMRWDDGISAYKVCYSLSLNFTQY